MMRSMRGNVLCDTSLYSSLYLIGSSETHNIGMIAVHLLHRILYSEKRSSGRSSEASDDESVLGEHLASHKR
jgi:hypothetical protein